MKGGNDIDISKMKIVEKSEYEKKQQECWNTICEYDKLSKAHLLGEINLIFTLLNCIKENNINIDKEYLKELLKLISKEHEWVKELIDTIL